MSLSRIRIRNILLWLTGIVAFFWAFLYSDQVMIGFSEFSFLSWSEEIQMVSFDITWGFTTGLTVLVQNKEDINMTYKLWFVDAGVTNDSFSRKTCLSENENQIVWQYITGNTTPFTLAAHSSGTQNISVNFPNNYSGSYTWCVTLNAISTNGSDDINTLPTRGIFLDALVYPNVFEFVVKAYPSNRVYQMTNNANSWIVKIYDTNRQFVASSNIFELDEDGYGTGEITLAPWDYYIVFKGQSHLASYLSWWTITGLWTDVFDFTTGANLYETQENSAWPNWWRYQTAGDLKNTSDQYDYIINGNDISIMLYGTFPEYGVDALNPRNLNGDWAINASDISIIGNNVLKQDVFAADGWIFIWQ